jgi:hypothetical protein
MTSPDAQPIAELEIDGEDLLVRGEQVANDRRGRLFFRSVLGATPIDRGWRCPRRRSTMPQLIVRVYDWLEARGYQVEGQGKVEAVVERELERRRSFARTSAAATALRSGEGTFPFTAVDGALDSFGWSRPLLEHQRSAVAHALTAVNAANFSVPGSGKTAATLAVAATHLEQGTINLVVVIGPLACFDPWEHETALCVGDHIIVRRGRGPATRRQSIYDSVRSRQLLLLSYATAAADQESLRDLFNRYQVMMIVDESHRIKRFRGGLWAPALAELARSARLRMVLSGTPMPQSGRDLYSQLNVLWPDGQLTGTRDAFASRVKSGFNSVIADVLPFTSRTPKAALDLPPYTIERHPVPLSGTQLEIYELILNNFRQQLSDADTWKDKLDALRRARPLRLMQAAANPDLLNRNDNYYKVPRVPADENVTLMERLATYRSANVPAKSLVALDLIRQIIQDGGKVVCWSNFVANLDDFSALVRTTVRVPTYQIDGRVPAGFDALHSQKPSEEELPGEFDTREIYIEKFLTNPGPAVLVTNPASCSESISLHSSCHNAIYLDRTYDCALFLQSIDRIHRLGLTPDVKVTIHILLATVDSGPSIDELIDTSLQRKDQQMRYLLEGAELAPIALGDDPLDDADGDDTDLGDLLRYLVGEIQ